MGLFEDQLGDLDDLLEKQSDGTTASRKLLIAPYLVPVPEAERASYNNMRLKPAAVAAE